MSGVEGQVPAAADVGLPAGMGSQSRPQSALQGFGYSKERAHTGEYAVYGVAQSRKLLKPLSSSSMAVDQCSQNRLLSYHFYHIN